MNNTTNNKRNCPYCGRYMTHLEGGVEDTYDVTGSHQQYENDGVFECGNCLYSEAEIIPVEVEYEY